MKKLLIISLWATVIATVSNVSFSFAYYYVCIDPGHGGSDSATVGPVYGVREKNANLTVALTLKSKIEYYISPVYMTRTIDTTVTLYRRAWLANNANDGSPVNYFVSVHHNASTDTSVNGTETYYCDTAYTDSAFGYQSRGFEIMYGARDSTFAKKVRLILRDSLQHTYRCSPQILCGDTTRPCCMKCWYVLRNTTMQSVLSEASFITNPWVEYQFYASTDYIDKEADAICTGWWSTYLMGGIAVVRNGYSAGADCGYGGLVAFGDYYNDLDTVPSPYEAVWTLGEGHYVQAVTPQNISGNWYTFHHWTHLYASGEPFGEECYEPLWWVSTGGEFDYHRYVAFFTGGSYSAQVDTPNGYENWHPGEQRHIVWDASLGADSTTLINVFLDRNGGDGGYPEHLLTDWPAKWSNFYTWSVIGDYSTHCRIKIVAEDIAGNSAEDVSDDDFIISESGNNNPEIDGHIQCKYPESQCYNCIQYGEAVTIEIPAHDPDGDSMYFEWYSFLGHFPNGQDRITTPQNYVIYTAPTKGKEGEETPTDDYISVGVSDVRGGQSPTFAVGYPELHNPEYSCLCGDANADSIIDLGDVLYLKSYLYCGGNPPPDPYERGDVNNDCLIDMGDMLYLVSYLYKGGSYPKCCWFPPNQ